jgi:hypothetical protein
MIDGTTINNDEFYRWRDGDWQLGEGRTTTGGAVLKPLRWLSLHVNKSNSFKPTEVGYGMYRNILPDPSGRGEDYGFSLSFFDNKVVLRANRYKTTQVNTRNGSSGSIAQRAYRLDFSSTTGRADNLQRVATAWITEQATAQGQTLTTAQLNQRLADTMKLPLSFIEDPPPSATAADDVTARGTELEIHFNPTNYWTMRANITQQESINSALAAEAVQWIEERLAIWPTIIDPRVGRPWWKETYNGMNAENFYLTQVGAPLSIARAFVGRSRPQIRKYRANFLTNFRLSGITDQRILKAFTVGGAVRWEDKGAIGFWGVQQPPAQVTDIDPNRPIYDKAHAYFDAFVTYRTKLFSGRVGLSLQLNARNLTEGGRLQPVAVEADGRVSSYRIVDPRMFILSATFSL